MPLYDFVVMLKGAAQKREVVDILKIAAQRVHAGEGVVVDVKSFGRVPLAYDIKKRDGRHREGQLMQMTVMAPTSFPKDLEFLNKDERLLRWMVVKNRGSRWLRGIDSRDQSILPDPSSKTSPFADEFLGKNF